MDSVTQHIIPMLAVFVPLCIAAAIEIARLTRGKGEGV